MSFRVIGNWVAISPNRETEKIGDIFLPDTTKTPVIVGTVEKVGDGTLNEFGEWVANPVLVPGVTVTYKGAYAKISEIEDKSYDFLLYDYIDVAYIDRNIIPLSDRVLVEVPEWIEKDVGGIQTPETFLRSYYESKVIAVGFGRRSLNGWNPLNVDVGSTVLFHRYSGMPITYNGVSHFVIRASDILGVK